MNSADFQEIKEDVSRGSLKFEQIEELTLHAMELRQFAEWVRVIAKRSEDEELVEKINILLGAKSA